MQKTPHPGDVSRLSQAATVISFFSILALDRITKIFFEHRLTSQSSITLTSWLGLSSHKNYGIVANLPLPQTVTVSISLLAIASIVYVFIKPPHPLPSNQKRALAVLLAGIIGNVWDRLINGYVFDWILLGGRSVINVADIAILGGALWYIQASSRKPLTSSQK